MTDKTTVFSEAGAEAAAMRVVAGSGMGKIVRCYTCDKLASRYNKAKVPVCDVCDRPLVDGEQL